MRLILFYDTLWDVPLDTGQALPGFEFSVDRDRIGEADAVVFHLPQWTPDRLRGRLPWAWVPALPKRPGQLWVAWSMECELHYPLMADDRFMRLFDLHMTYRLDSDVPTPYVDTFGSADSMIEAFRKPSGHPALFAGLVGGAESASQHLAPLASFISSNDDLSGRRAYLTELARHIDIDAYGIFQRNRSLDADRGRDTKLAVIAQYPFTIAFENACAHDYVTEKFFDPLWAGSVPVYLGASNVDRFAPGDDCYIDAGDFARPQDLAEHLRGLLEHPAAYAKHLAWKMRPFRPEFESFLTSWAQRPLSRLCESVRRRLNR